MPSTFDHIQSKVQSWEGAVTILKTWQNQGLEIVFTNGCFDLLHYGHISYLSAARDLGDKLVVGLNSASSVRRLKGPTRPINDEETRKCLMAALECVDLVVLFEEDTPLNLIDTLLPDILVKGGDWRPDQIVGSDIILAHGGKVLSLPYIDGYSTTNLEKKILEQKNINQ